jgi:hypothetical protein
MSGDERDQLLTDISKAAAAVGQNPAGGERKAHKIVFITHPYV